jgi:hypothetical protein
MQIPDLAMAAIRISGVIERRVNRACGWQIHGGKGVGAKDIHHMAGYAGGPMKIA